MVNDLSCMMLKAQVDVLYGVKRIGGRVKEGVKSFFTDEKGDTNIISIVLILVVVIGLAVLFRDNITKIVGNLWTTITGKLGNAGNGVNTDAKTDF